MAKYFSSVEAVSSTVQYQTRVTVAGDTSISWLAKIQIPDDDYLPAADFIALADTFAKAVRDAIKTHQSGTAAEAVRSYPDSRVNVPEVPLT